MSFDFFDKNHQNQKKYFLSNRIFIPAQEALKPRLLSLNVLFYKINSGLKKNKICILIVANDETYALAA